MIDIFLLINRIKPHTSFRGDYESGLMKMITIGMGKQRGADICHAMGMGRMAVETVLGIADGVQPASQHLELATTLSVRESTGPAPGRGGA